MLTKAQIRKKYLPVSPCQALDDLAMILNHPKKEGFSPPLTTIVMISGNTFKGHLINASPADATEKAYLFVLDSDNGDGASDLVYLQAHRIESVTFWNVEDYSGILPRFKDKRAEP